jgi:carbamoyl-phosphate synthase large subunit
LDIQFLQREQELLELEVYLKEAVEVSNQKPILLDSYLTDAIEIDIDVISDGKNVEIGGILQHIEQAGVHSGDSACAIPPYNIDKKIEDKIRKEVTKVIENMEIIGLVNVQIAYVNNTVYLLD